MQRIIYLHRLLQTGMNKKFLLYIFTSPYVLSLVLMLLTYFVVPIEFPELMHEEIYHSNYSPNTLQSIQDLNNDGKLEKVIVMKTNTTPQIELRDLKNNYLAVTRLHGKVLEFFPLYFSDYNHNHLDEIVFFSMQHDSVILNFVELYAETTPVKIQKAICKVPYYNDVISLSISPAKMIDYNDDGFSDIIFSLNAHYALQPRKTFIYDIHHDTLLATPLTGAITTRKVVTAGKGSEMRLYCGTSATENYSKNSTVPYSDWQSHLFAFDHKLQFAFEPLSVKYKSSIEVYLTSEEKHSDILAIVSNNDPKIDSITSFLISHQGSVIKRLSLPDPEKELQFVIFHDSIHTVKRVFINHRYSNHVDEYDLNFNYVQTYHVETLTYSYGEEIILNGEPFYITNYAIRGYPAMVIYSQRLKEVLKLDRDFQGYNFTPLIFSGEKILLRGISFNKGIKLLEITKNPYYFINVLLLPMIYAFFLGLILFSQKLYSIRLKNRQNLIDQIYSHQLKASLNQADPHFIFNSLNGISALLTQANSKDANKYLVKLSKLIRSSLKSADELTNSLTEEIEFVKNFLELEKFRYEEKLKWHLEIEADVDLSIHIPRMIIQSHVENAIKHGLSPREEMGNIYIRVFGENNSTYVFIEDNGVGRSNAGESTGTGKGITLGTEIYDLYNKLFNKRLKQSVVDLKDGNGNPIGTRIELKVS